MRKTTVFGYSMQTRSARRRLVVALYASLALALIGGFFLDRLHVSGYYIYFAALFINWKILGETLHWEGPAQSAYAVQSD
jgi:hypothetical protein